MRSSTPKPLQEIAGRAMLDYVLDAVDLAGRRASVVVVGHESERVAAAARRHPGSGVVVVEQPERRGTADAVAVALGAAAEALGGADGDVLVALADTPLLRSTSVRGLLAEHASRDAALSVLTAIVADPTGYGRIVRGPSGDLERIVEDRDATGAERHIAEVNTGVIVARFGVLARALERLEPHNAQGEYYLSDAIDVVRRDGLVVAALALEDPDEGLGVNDGGQLEHARAVLAERARAGR